MSPYILGIDVGTTSIKAVLLERGSRAVVASQTLPTAADVADSSGIKVSTLARQNFDRLLSDDTDEIRLLFNITAGKRTANLPHHRCSQPVRLSAAQRQTGACQQRWTVRTDARGVVLEGKER